MFERLCTTNYIKVYCTSAKSQGLCGRRNLSEANRGKLIECEFTQYGANNAANPQYVAENVFSRDFHAPRPNMKWLTDVIEFKWYEEFTKSI